MLTHQNLEKLEKKYFNKIYSTIQSEIYSIIDDLKRIDIVKNQWIDIAFPKKTNLFDEAAERIFREAILRSLKWKYLPIPISSDECFELANEVIHLDFKTTKGTERIDLLSPDQVNIDYKKDKKINFRNIIVGRNQVTLPKMRFKLRFKKKEANFSDKKHGIKNGYISWHSNLPLMYDFENKKKICLTYFLKLTYNSICPFCEEIQDIGPANQKKMKKEQQKRAKNKYICCPYGKWDYSIKNTCTHLFKYPSFRLESVVLYSFPHGSLIKKYYNYGKRWFEWAQYCYKAADKEGILAARIQLNCLKKPKIKPEWWEDDDEFNRIKDIEFEPIVIIKGV